VVVNGNAAHAETIESLSRDKRVTVVHQEAADLPAALRLGRSLVTTRWFATLDDDDVLLPGALAARCNALAEPDGFDTVVTNGYRRSGLESTLHVPDMREVARDPLGALMSYNWLLPGAWMCATDASSERLFEAMPRHLECTYLAIRLSTDRKVRFLNVPTVAWATDTPGSASKSRGYRLGQAAAILRLLELEVPPPLRAHLRNRLAAARHEAARIAFVEGNTRQAWLQQIRSLQHPQGWGHLAFTFRLAAGWRQKD
jgi:hypothetical protein